MAASAAIPAEAAVPLALNTIRLNDGSIHPVSPQWYARNVMKARIFREDEGRRQALMHVGTDRRLTAQLRRELEALTEFRNVNRAYKHLDGRDYREIFGQDATVDQVHMNRVRKSCGCVLNYVFDHNQRAAAETEIHPHYPTAVCAAHSSLAGDINALFAVAMRG